MKSTTLILLPLLCFLFSCTKHIKENKPKDNRVVQYKDSTLNAAKYFYIGSDSILHVDLKCGQPRLAFDEINHKYSVRRIQLKDITYKELENCCAVCINDNRYDILKHYVDSIHEIGRLHNSNK